MIDINHAWNALEQFMDSDTHILYDSSLGRAALPSREQVRDDVPNQVGWTSGFEDAALNAGFLLPYIIQLAEKTDDEKWKSAAALFADVLLKLVTVGTPGFVARGVLPDGVTHYRDSSVDQYTMAFRGAYAITQWDDAGAERKKRAAQFVGDVIALLRRHQWDIPTADEKERGWIGETSEFYADRASRLLQFALVNAIVNPSEESLALYRHLRDECQSRRMRGLFSKPGYVTVPYAMLQTQVSLRMLCDLEPDAEYKKVWQIHMEDLAENAILRLQARDFAEIIEKINHFSDLPEPIAAMRLYTDEDYANRGEIQKAASFVGRYYNNNIRMHAEQEYLRQPLELALCFALAENENLVDYNGSLLAPTARDVITQILQKVRLEDLRLCHSVISIFTAAVWMNYS